MKFFNLLLILFTICLLGGLAHANKNFQVVIIGADESYDKLEATLNYANTDAERVAKAMRMAGRVPQENIHRLKNPTMQEFRRVIHKVGKKSTNKFMFYYSGHSDERGLHLKDGLIGKAQFHDMLDSVKANIKVVVLDSCFSGALKAKGVKKTNAIQLVQYSVDEPTGSVILTSSSEQELSYESEALKGSIFTYHLVSGIYGQADGNLDGIVSVDELYQYVYAETKFQSLVSGGKTQRPEFASRLTGQGALVISYPSQINGTIKLSSELHGELTLASANGVTYFKFFKNRGKKKYIRLPGGHYKMTLVEKARTGQGVVELLSTERVTLRRRNFVWQELTSPDLKEKGKPSSSLPKNEFLFGFKALASRGFEGGKGSGSVGEVFVLSPHLETPIGRWRGSVHLGGQLNDTNKNLDVEYIRDSLGAEVDFDGVSSWRNIWYLGIRVGGLRPTGTSTDTFETLTFSRVFLGTRFFPKIFPVKLGINLGVESGEAENGKGLGDYTSLALEISY